MTRRLAFAAVLLAVVPILPQQVSYRFDPVTTLGMLHIHRAWSVDAFPIPSGAVRSFGDSLISNDELVGFTMALRNKDSAGWSMWLDFDADKLRAMRLVRVFARMAVSGEEERTFPRLVSRIDTILHRRLMDKQSEGDTLVSWRWIPRDGYRLQARLARPADTAAPVFLLKLDKHVGR